MGKMCEKKLLVKPRFVPRHSLSIKPYMSFHFVIGNPHDSLLLETRIITITLWNQSLNHIKIMGLEAIFFILEVWLLSHLVSSQWTKVLKHSTFSEYRIKFKEPRLCDKTVQQYSGYFDIKDTKHLFFWFFESRSKPQEDPIVLWLSGGPGNPSVKSLYFELGPCFVNPGGNDTTLNPYSWNNNSSLIFLDQPINTGYSYGDDVSDSFTAAHDIYAFLQIFFQEFRQYANLNFHIAVNPLVQFKYYPDIACDSPYGPVLDNSACNQMRKDYIQCAKLTKTCYDSKNIPDCVTAEQCFNGMTQIYRNTNRSDFDIRKSCKEDSCYPELQDIAKYCNREDVKIELGVNLSLAFQLLNANIFDKFFNSGDIIRRFDIYIPSLLESKIRVLIYAGEFDFISNWLGCDAWTKALKWSGTEGFNNANISRWITTTGNYAGDVRTFKGFTFLKILNSGHLVPVDQPIA
ncbi:27636_t:CDS:10, partial [Racocetra persica]